MKENSIEEDITRVKQRIEDVKEYIEYGLPYSEYLDLENSFDNILSDYKRVLKENEELKDFKKQVTYIENTNFIKYKNYIPVQIIEDFYKKYQKLSDEFYEKFLETNRTDKDLHDVGLACDAKVQVLQELLESEK